MDIKDFSQVTVILRGYSYEVVRNICFALKETESIRNVEITMNTPNVFETIQKISEEFKADLNIGAGTVTTLDEAKKSIEGGAQFLLAPTVMDKAIMDFAKGHGVLTISGAYTPTEVFTAYQNGSDIIKIFPINSLALSYIKSIKAPLGNIPIMAVGGVNRENAKALLSHGADYLGVGGMFSKSALESNCLATMINEGKAFEKEL